MEELISVIVPVYNVKPFLVECLDSIINQTYKNLEIILVDDGSNDGSEKICDEYKEKDDRIKVIHQRNRGLSVARNIGIEKSNGKYLTFVDSDDYIHKEMLEVLYENIKKYNCEISICNYSNNEDLKIRDAKNIEIFDSLEKMLGQLYNKYGICFGTAWGKLYKRNIFDSLRYPENKKYEDIFIIHKIYGQTKKLVFSNNSLYFYRIRENSLMNSKYSLNNLDELEAILDRMNFVKERNFEYFYARDFYRYVNALKRHYIQIKKYFPKEREKLGYIIKEFNSMYNRSTRKLIIKNKLRWKLDLFKIRMLFHNMFLGRLKCLMK